MQLSLIPGCLALVVGLLCVPSRSIQAEAPPANGIFAPRMRAQNAKDCEIAVNAVWVTSAKWCLTYFPTARIDTTKPTLLVFLGDIPREHEANSTYEYQMLWQAIIMAQLRSNRHQMAVVIFSRPGYHGSSGYRSDSYTKKGMQAISDAIDIFLTRHRLETFHIAGQSAGANVALSLLTKGRAKIGCAVLASSLPLLLEAIDEQDRARNVPLQRLHNPAGAAEAYDPSAHLHGIVSDPSRRIIAVGDARDVHAPFALQRKVVQSIAALGHSIDLIERVAQDSGHHSLLGEALDLAGRCIDGRPGGSTTSGGPSR